MTRVLIVGAGITGAVTASLLKCRLPQNSHIAVWEMCSGAGGRLKTVFSESSTSCFANLGAQYISPSAEEYSEHSRFYEELENSGLLQPLVCRVEGVKQSLDTRHYIVTKGMASLVEHYLAKSGAEMYYDTTLSELSLQADRFIATASGQQKDEFDCVVLTMPVPQVLQLRGDITQILASQPEVEKQLRLVEYSARYAVGVFLDNGPWNDMDWGMKYFDDPVIRYISINGGHTTPADDKTYALVVHTTVPFGLDNINCNVESVCYNVVLSRLRQLLPRLPTSLTVKPHRWQYSQVYKGYNGAPAAVIMHRSPTLVLGGDAFTYSKFDGCLTSATKIVSSICEHLVPQNSSSTTVKTESFT